MSFQIICALCILLHMSSGTYSSKILGLFTSPHRSHMLVYLGFVRCLLERGHNITIVTVLPVQNLVPRDVRIIQLKKPPEADRMYGIFRQIAVVAASSRTFDDPRMRQFLQEDNHFDLVIIGYLFNDYQLGVAAHFNCPSVVIWTTQPISFVNRFIGNPNGWSYVPQPFVRSQAVGVSGILYGVFDGIFKWILDFIMDNVYRELFASSKYPSLEQMQKNVSLVFCNHHFSEGPVSAHLPGIIEISSIQIETKNILPKVLQDFMDSAEQGIIYFSLGTVVSPKQLKSGLLQIFFEVLSSLPQKVVWKIDDFTQNSSNIFTGKWFSQTSILAHSNTRLFITHGGKGSTIEALHFAVPMIAIPMFGDQFADAYRLKKNGFGLVLDKDSLTELSLREHISEILNNDTYSHNINIASEIYKDRPISSQETVVYWTEYVIRYRGAVHMQSPTAHMNLIQYLNIDVYFFCICFLYLQNLVKMLYYTVKKWLEKTIVLYYHATGIVLRNS